MTQGLFEEKRLSEIPAWMQMQAEGPDLARIHWYVTGSPCLAKVHNPHRPGQLNSPSENDAFRRESLDSGV